MDEHSTGLPVGDLLLTDGVVAEVNTERAWSAAVLEIAAQTLLVGTDSWFNSVNVPGKPRGLVAFLAGLPAYRNIVADVVSNGYHGFRLT